MKKCKHENQFDENIYYDEHGAIEYDTFCANCGKYLGHWAYGYYDLDYDLNYRLKGLKKMKVKLKIWIENIIFKFKYRKSIKNNELPF